jgi:hypothetical protein
MTVNLRLICTDFPGLAFGQYKPVYLAVQRGRDLVDLVPGDSERAEFVIPLEVGRRADGSPSFRGSFAQGKPGEQFVYLVWFVNRPSGPERFRRAKIMLDHLTWDALRPDATLRAHIRLTDKRGEPVCARLRVEQIEWEPDA